MTIQINEILTDHVMAIGVTSTRGATLDINADQKMSIIAAITPANIVNGKLSKDEPFLDKGGSMDFKPICSLNFNYQRLAPSTFFDGDLDTLYELLEIEVPALLPENIEATKKNIKMTQDNDVDVDEFISNLRRSLALKVQQCLKVLFISMAKYVANASLDMSATEFLETMCEDKVLICRLFHCSEDGEEYTREINVERQIKKMYIGQNNATAH